MTIFEFVTTLLIQSIFSSPSAIPVADFPDSQESAQIIVAEGIGTPITKKVLRDYPRSDPRVPQWALCSCVQTVKYILGRENEVWGDAKDILPNSAVPIIGGLILLNEGQGHIALVLNYSDNHITFEEGNAIPCGKSVRSIPRDYPLIRGFKKI